MSSFTVAPGPVVTSYNSLGRIESFTEEQKNIIRFGDKTVSVMDQNETRLARLTLGEPLAIEDGGTGQTNLITSTADTVNFTQVVTSATDYLLDTSGDYWFTGTLAQKLILPLLPTTYSGNTALKQGRRFSLFNASSATISVYRIEEPTVVLLTIPATNVIDLTVLGDTPYANRPAVTGGTFVFGWLILSGTTPVKFASSRLNIWANGLFTTPGDSMTLRLPVIGDITVQPVDAVVTVYNDTDGLVHVTDNGAVALATIPSGHKRYFKAGAEYEPYPSEVITRSWQLNAQRTIPGGPPVASWDFRGGLNPITGNFAVENGVLKAGSFTGVDKWLNTTANQFIAKKENLYWFKDYTEAANGIILYKESPRHHFFSTNLANPTLPYNVWLPTDYSIILSADEYNTNAYAYEYYFENKTTLDLTIYDTDTVEVAVIKPGHSAQVINTGNITSAAYWQVLKYLPALSGPSGNILVSDGSNNWVSSTPPSTSFTAPGPVNSVLVSDGTTDWDVSEGTTDRNRILTSTSGNVPKWDLAFPTVVIGSYTPTIQFFYAGSEGASTQSVGTYGTRHGRFDYVECFPSDTVSSSNDRKRLITLDVYITVTTYAGSQTFLDEIRLPLPFSNNNFLSTSVTINNGGNCSIIFTSDTGQAYIRKATTATIFNGYTLTNGDVWHFSASYLHTP